MSLLRIVENEHVVFTKQLSFGRKVGVLEILAETLKNPNHPPLGSTTRVEPIRTVQAIDNVYTASEF